MGRGSTRNTQQGFLQTDRQSLCPQLLRPPGPLLSGTSAPPLRRTPLPQPVPVGSSYLGSGRARTFLQPTPREGRGSGLLDVTPPMASLMSLSKRRRVHGSSWGRAEDSRLPTQQRFQVSRSGAGAGTGGSALPSLCDVCLARWVTGSLPPVGEPAPFVGPQGL